ncbi:hypothetical protein [Methylococcus sp. Mc7]|uniref:hypothetical protein n=1 Tax=Methylococcus sp. Mc7 TaxID=2860258 RepID=UPI00351D43C5
MFGARSEKLKTLPDSEQLPLSAEVPRTPRRQSGGVQDGGAIAGQESAQTHRAAGASAARDRGVAAVGGRSPVS